jgi:hypothetical protein
MNGVSDESGTLNWAVRLKKKIIFQWMGTDVLNAVNRNLNGTLNRKYLDKAVHFFDAPWFESELKPLGLKNVFESHFKYLVKQNSIKKYDKIKVISYVSKNREDFYGLPKIVEAAKQFPKIQFSIYGTDIFKDDFPENLKCHGWISSECFQDELIKSAIFLRLTEHDGFSASCIEAFGMGAEVIWSYPWRYAQQAQSTVQLITAIQIAIVKIEERGYLPNLKNRERATELFDRKNVILNYIGILKNQL